MNWKPTWVLLAAALVMFAFIVLVEHPLRRRQELQASHLILPGLDPALVTNVEILPWGRDMIQAVRSNSNNALWNLVKPAPYPARPRLLPSLLAVLANLQWTDRFGAGELAEQPSAQEDFGFSKPAVTILLQGAGPDRRLEIGNLGVFGDRVFVQVVGNTAIYQVPSALLQWLPADKYLWRDPSLLNLTNLAFQTLQVRAAGKEFDLERDATNHLWVMRKLSLVARADTAKINLLLGQLQTMSVSNFVTDDPQADLDFYGLQKSDTTPALSLAFLDGTNVVAGLQLGRGATNHPGLAFARRDHLGSIVEVAQEPLTPWLAPYTNFLDQHFVSVSPSLVASIAIQGDDRFVLQKQTNGQWMVQAGPEHYAADSNLVEYVLATLTNVPTEIVKTVVTDYSEYGLNPPALQYTVRFGAEAGARAEARLEFGTNKAGKVFERRLGEDGVNTISADDYAGLPRDSWQLRDRQVWNFHASNVVSITIHQRGGTLKYLRDPDGNWTYAPGDNSQVFLNSPAVQECVVRMGRLRAVYWDAVGEEHLERFGFAAADHDVEFEVKQGGATNIYRIQFGARSPYLHPYASVTRDGRRLVFEFPADFYQELVEPNLTLYTARHH